jgi:hypothetical protein
LLVVVTLVSRVGVSAGVGAAGDVEGDAADIIVAAVAAALLILWYSLRSFVCAGDRSARPHSVTSTRGAAPAKTTLQPPRPGPCTTATGSNSLAWQIRAQTLGGSRAAVRARQRSFPTTTTTSPLVGTVVGVTTIPNRIIMIIMIIIMNVMNIMNIIIIVVIIT